MKKVIMFSLPAPNVITKISPFLFHKPNTIFGYMPSDGADQTNEQYLPFWQELCAKNISTLRYLNNTDPNDITKIAECDTLMITGGDTVKLLHNLRTFHFDQAIINFTQKDNFVLAGFSAGAIVLTPRIDVITKDWEFKKEDEEEVMSESKGLGLVEFEIVPHYDSVQDASLLADYRQESPNEVRAITDEEYIVLDCN